MANGQIRSIFGFTSGSKSEANRSSDRSADRKEVSIIFAKFAQLIHASQRPIPPAVGNAASIEGESGASSSSIWQDMQTIGINDVKTLKDLVGSKMAGDVMDDKTYLMERVIQLVADLPAQSKTRVDLTNAFIDGLWDSLQHPPMSYIGDMFAYRQPDGSSNNVMNPQLGAANTAYARSVMPKTVTPDSMPDPGLVFDCLFARQNFREHPNKVSSILFYWASLIIHDLFQTDHRDFNMSQTSSYLDLSPLYGDNWEDQKLMRTFTDGKLKPDCFSESRLLLFPPGCGVLLIMFNRFHNYVVEQLAAINENGKFSQPQAGLSKDAHSKATLKRDQDLFETGRLITCGLYMNITLLDYLRTIVNLNRTNSTWTLDPRVDMEEKVFGKDGSPRGVGNQVSAEFNLVYRWHSAISLKDEAWAEKVYQDMFGKPAADVSLPEALAGMHKLGESLDKDPQERPFASLQRGPDGKYKDDDLVTIMSDAIEDTAGAFGANNVPKALKAIEILGMTQARKWGLATLNEFRAFFKLMPHDSFESINSDPQVAEHLRRLYGHPDFVEMYPGLVAEEAKVPMVPGVGIAPTFTISRAILSDAVTLVRSDRYYTIDYHPKNLTNWGYNEAQYDLNIEQGCVFYKLFLRAFPHHFKPDSIYAHYPMTIPSENQKIMRNLGREAHYSYDRPKLLPPRINLSSYLAAKTVLEDHKSFRTLGGTLEELMGKEACPVPSGSTDPHSKQRQVLQKWLYKDNWQQDVKAFYEHITLKLLHKKSYKLAGINHVDITRDVGNLAPIHFAANLFGLPLRTEENPDGAFTERELYMAIAVIFACICFDIEPAKSFPLHMAAQALSEKLGTLVETTVRSVNRTGIVSRLVDSWRENDNALQDYGARMVRRLLDSGLSVEDIAWRQILPTTCAMVPNQAQVFTQILDFYLLDVNKEHLSEIHRLAKSDTPEAEEKLLGYCMEGIRLNGTIGVYREAHSAVSIDDGGKSVNIKPGDKVFVSFINAAKDASVFPDPDEVRIDRPLDSYIHYGAGRHKCLGKDASCVALTAMLKTVGRLENLRRAPGPRGQLRKISKEGGCDMYMREQGDSYFPFPMTMQVNWDGDLPPLGV
ncbi:heme peroxidase [Eremomyces bilateralis CBS 781.70]|uniref:Heme peroxidase n=1 Tax=Eremomyces bilateralis CBS 781.70 TaxID=1392243 RepID=A0A6G1GBW8_9PEZI|nr:heme peroxidase [Eremomyces bilateralis CBS 781.70]KAF1815585.1 heme peroxidase [Eremomyces bilateralis CBS 781.70]